jgi:hypothetical protein
MPSLLRSASLFKPASTPVVKSPVTPFRILEARFVADRDKVESVGRKSRRSNIVGMFAENRHFPGGDSAQVPDADSRVGTNYPWPATPVVGKGERVNCLCVAGEEFTDGAVVALSAKGPQHFAASDVRGADRLLLAEGDEFVMGLVEDGTFDRTCVTLRVHD